MKDLDSIRNPGNYVTVTPQVGSAIHEAALLAIERAKETGLIARFRFNRVECFATADDDAQRICRYYYSFLEALRS